MEPGHAELAASRISPEHGFHADLSDGHRPDSSHGDSSARRAFGI